MSEEEECLRRNGTYGTASPCGVVADAMFSNYTSSLDSNYTVNCTANTEAGRLLYSPYFQAAIYFSYCSIFVAALCGNGLVCYVVHSSPRMRTVTNYFIANLAVGDVLMTLFCVPFSFVSVLILQHWPFGDSMCKIVSYSLAVSVLVSAYTLVAISLDRYMAIMRPLRPRLSKRGAAGAVVGVWVFALATAAPIPIVSRPTQPSEWYVECSKYMCHEDWPSLTQSYHYSMVLMALQYFMPLSVLVATYARIAVVVWGKRTPGEAENTRDQRMARSKRKGDKSLNRLGMKSRYEFRNSNQTLFIERSETNDSGIYECIVKNSAGSIRRNFNVTLMTGQSTLSNSSVTAVCIAIAIIGILLIALACLIWRMKKERKRAHTLTVQDVTAFHEGALQTVDPDLAIDEQADLLPYKKDFEFPREKLKFGKQLGTGAFGRVVKAEAEGLKEEEKFTTVAVKMVKPHSDISHLKALMTELKLLIYIGHHLNVLNLLGACTTDLIYKELFVILEYCRYGNLHSYLQRHRESFINQVNPLTDVVDYSIGKDANLRPIKEKVSPNPSGETSRDSRVMFDNSSGQLLHSDTAGEASMSKMADSSGSSIPVDLRWNIRYKSDFKGKLAAPLNTKDLLCWSYRVAMGMEYLASIKIVHADLAARNILLADENIVKICDFGLARNLYKNMDYKKTGKDPLPIKWMATEAIVDRVFSTKSDVWSFGVVLWELFSLAKTPYPGIMVNEQFLQQLIEGTRMAKPEYSTREMYRVMLDCWKSNPSDRPNFTDLVHRIGDALDSDIKQHYLELNTPYVNQNVKAMARNTYVNYSDESNSEYIHPEFPERENVKMKKFDDSTLNKLKRISEEDSDNPAFADELQYLPMTK